MLTLRPAIAALWVAEQALRRRTEGLDDPLLVDDDGGIGNRIEDRAEMGFTGVQILRVRAVANPGAAELFAEPGDAGADQGEDAGFKHRRIIKHGAAGEQEPTAKTKRRGQQPGA